MADTEKRTCTTWLHRYLQDHDAGAAAGLALFQRAANSHRDPAARREIGALLAEVGQDRDALREIMRRLDVSPSRMKTVTARVAEKAARLKMNGRLFRRSPLSDVVETEALVIGVRGKEQGWKSLLAVADCDDRLDAAELQRLIERAQTQAMRLERLHDASARAAFT